MSKQSKDGEIIYIAIEKVRIDGGIYPRQAEDTDLVKRYTELVKANAKFPPIMVDKDKTLIDGYHRLQAHIKAGKKEILARVIEPAEAIKAIETASMLNAVHGFPFSPEEKRKNAKKLYQLYKRTNGHVSKKDMEKIARVVGAGTRTVYRWLSDYIKQEKDRAIQKALELRAQGKSLREVEKETGIAHTTIYHNEKKVYGVSLTAYNKALQAISVNAKRIEECVQVVNEMALIMVLLDRKELREEIDDVLKPMYRSLIHFTNRYRRMAEDCLPERYPKDVSPENLARLVVEVMKSGGVQVPDQLPDWKKKDPQLPQ